jgi:hypothetical protein
MATTFKHRKISNDKREKIAEKLAIELLGPKPDMSHLKPRAESILKQVDAIVMQDPTRQAWFDLPSGFHSSIKQSNRYHQLWCNNEPDLTDIFRGMDSDERIHNISGYQIENVCRAMDVYLADIDYRYINSDDIREKMQTQYSDVYHFMDFVALEKHVPKTTIDHTTLVKDHNGYEVTLYDALAKIAVEYATYDVNLNNLERKLRDEMEDCTTKQVIEAWPQAEQLIYDAYDFQPNVSKPTAPLSQVLADAGILQIAAQ